MNLPSIQSSKTLYPDRVEGNMLVTFIVHSVRMGFLKIFIQYTTIFLKKPWTRKIIC